MRVFATLELATDLMVMGARSSLHPYSERIVQRTADQPQFWFGNRTIFKSLPADVAEAEAQILTAFQDHPEAGFSVISWDVPNGDIGPVQGVFEAAGYKIEMGLSLVGMQAHRPGVPEGFEFRQITSDADWRSVTELQLAGMIGDGYDKNTAEDYIVNRFVERRDTSADGRGGWFGLFEDALLVADMGLVWSPELVRFQSVETRQSHRRRGLCAALLGEVSACAAARFPMARQVIVADDDAPAVRVYRRAGYHPSERVVSALRSPK